MIIKKLMAVALEEENVQNFGDLGRIFLQLLESAYSALTGPNITC